jgi:hypothetical protein
MRIGVIYALFGENISGYRHICSDITPEIDTVALPRVLPKKQLVPSDPVPDDRADTMC